MQSTSLDRPLDGKGTNSLLPLDRLAGLSPVDFDQAVKPLRKKLEDLDTDGELSKLFLETNVTNHLVDGLYVRELLLPEGSVVLSRVHKKPLVNIISKGSVLVVDTNGRHTYNAPATFTSPAGTQRLVIAGEETVWNTVHPTDVTNPDDLVDELTADNYEDYISYSQQLTHQER